MIIKNRRIGSVLRRIGSVLTFQHFLRENRERRGKENRVSSHIPTFSGRIESRRKQQAEQAEGQFSHSNIFRTQSKENRVSSHIPKRRIGSVLTFQHFLNRRIVSVLTFQHFPEKKRE